ncbi:MAG TPA: glycosyltransferase family 39 protein [Opitutaceae bacterium]|nr:glycosyltransferase family 39 protein [Opitutaceae bacterium]
MSRRLLLFALTSALALVLGFVTLPATQAMVAVRYTGYWFVLVATAWFGIHLVRSLREDWPALRAWRSWWRAGLVVAAGTLILHVHERHEFKIVADEVVLQLTAQRMHFAREAGVVLRGYDYAGNFTPFMVTVDKRPLFFPFLLSLVHDLTGYRVSNAFALNAVLSLALMTLALLVARRIGGWGAGCTAVLLLAGVPLIAQNACGSGFDLLNLVMILLVWWLGMRWADRPQDDDRLAAFVLGAVLLLQVRYESVLFLLPVGAVILYLWWHFRQIRLPWALLAAPLLLLVIPWQYNVFKVLDSYWQLNSIQGATTPFGLRYFYDNVGHAMNFFLDFDGLQPNSWLVGIAGTLGVGFFILVLYRHYRGIFRDRPGEAVYVLFVAGLLVHTAFMLCYFWGTWDDPVIRRLSLPAHLLLVFSLVYIWPRLVLTSRRWLISGVAAGAYLVAFSLPTAAMHRYDQENFAARATNWLRDFIRTQGEEPVLAIDNNSGLLWFLYGKACINPWLLSHRVGEFLYHWDRRSFTTCYVVQRVGIDAKTGEPFISADDDLGPGVKLEVVKQKAFSPIYLVRLSRVVSIDEPKLKAWADGRMKQGKGGGPLLQPIPGSAEAAQLLEWLRNLP